MSLNTATDVLESQVAPKTTGGEVMGKSADDPIGFHGAEPRAQEELELTSADRTGDTGGEADGEYEDVSTAVGEVENTGSADKADVDLRLVAIANNFAEVAEQLAQITADLDEIKTKLANKGLVA